MRALGGLLLAVGLVLAVIAGAWGRSGFYVEQAPALLALGVAALICLGAGAAMLRYRKPGFASGSATASTAADRALGRATLMPSPPQVPAVSAVPTVAVPAIVPQPRESTGDAVDEKTRDRMPCAGDWVLALPDATVLPISDGLVIGRQPVSADGGPAAAVPSPEVSKSHARFRIVDGRLGVRDLDSTNGTVIVHPDDTEERVSPVAETPLGPGDRLEIGSYVLEVQRHH